MRWIIGKPRDCSTALLEALNAETAQQRLADVRGLPLLRQTIPGDAVDLNLCDDHYTLREAAYVLRLNGTICLLLTDAG